MAASIDTGGGLSFVFVSLRERERGREGIDGAAMADEAGGGRPVIQGEIPERSQVRVCLFLFEILSIYSPSISGGSEGSNPF